MLIKLDGPLQLLYERPRFSVLYGRFIITKEEAEFMDKIQALQSEQLKESVPELNIGDSVKVYNKIKEGAKERVQVYEGTIIARSGGGLTETFTVRRISYGIGVEKIFPVHSPFVEKVEIIRRGKVRRAKLYYLRDRVGKQSKVKEKI